MRADCHLAQYTDYEDPSDTSFLEEESSPFSPDLDFTNHQTNSFDDIDYSSPSQDHDISDTFDYTEDNFLDHDYGHDLMYDIYPLPCSPTSQTLDNPVLCLLHQITFISIMKCLQKHSIPQHVQP